jgi:branched-chain amino acid aminotransferase
MSVRSDGRQIQLHVAAPPGGAPLRLLDGDRVLWEGELSQGLRLELDGERWGVPEPLRELLAQSLPLMAENYSPRAFAPLATPWTGLATYTVDIPARRGRWSAPALIPGQTLPISVMAGVIHYAQSVFEGSKVFFRKMADGSVEARMFRTRSNAGRMWRSALRMGVPLEMAAGTGGPGTPETWDAFYLDLVRRTVRANVAAGLFQGGFQPHELGDPKFNWDATPTALYIRPALFATGPVLGVKPSAHYTLMMYVTPVGKYRGDLVLRLERQRPRAFHGGTGAVKASCNYAPTLTMMAELTENKLRATETTPWHQIYDDILFLNDVGDFEEMGGANFFVIGQEKGKVVLRTPSSIFEDDAADTILPGVTRGSLLEIATEIGMEVEVGPLPAARLLEIDEGEARRTAVFTSGTAAGVAPVVALLDGERVQRFAVWDDVDDPSRHRTLKADPAPAGSALAMGRLLRTLLFRIQLGDDAGVRNLLPKLGDRLLQKTRAEAWVEVFRI